MSSVLPSPGYKKPVVRFETVLCLVDAAKTELFNCVEIAAALGSDYPTLRDNTFDAFEELLTKLDYDQPISLEFVLDMCALHASVLRVVAEARSLDSVQGRVESFWRAHQNFMQLMFQCHVNYLRCVAMGESLHIPRSALDSVHAIVRGRVCGKRVRVAVD